MSLTFNDFLNGNCESIFSNREESDLLKAKKKIKDYFMENIFKMCLSKRESQIYILKNKKNLSHKEIAKLLGIEERTSRNTLCKAKAKIEKIAKDFKDFDPTML